MLVWGNFVSSLHSYIVLNMPVSFWVSLFIVRVVVKNWIVCVSESTKEMLSKSLTVILFVIFPFHREDRDWLLRGDWKSDKRVRPTDAQSIEPELAISWKGSTEIPAQPSRDAGLCGHLSCSKKIEVNWRQF